MLEAGIEIGMGAMAGIVVVCIGVYVVGTAILCLLGAALSKGHE